MKKATPAMRNANIFIPEYAAHPESGLLNFFERIRNDAVSTTNPAPIKIYLEIPERKQSENPMTANIPESSKDAHMLPNDGSFSPPCLLKTD